MLSKKSEKPFVSIILPVRNAERTLQIAIESIINQTYKHFECIIINDNSTDATPEILAQVSKQEKRIRCFNNSSVGIVSALNFGISVANGSFIARMDADDYSHPTRLEKQIEYFNKHPEIDFCGTKVAFTGNKKSSGGYAHYVNWTNTLVSTEDIMLKRFVESPFAHPCMMFRKSNVENFGGYAEGDFPEDYELWLRWMEAGLKPGKVDEILFDWADPPERLSRSDLRYSIESFYRIKSIYLQKWLEHHNPHHPKVIIWGSGRTTRKRVQFLEALNIEIEAFIDINPNKIGKMIHGIHVISPADIPTPNKVFLISYVSNRGARKLISDHLNKNAFIEGIHYICAA